MIIFSNAYFFPVLQILLFVVLVYALFKDILPRSNSGEFNATLTVTRSAESMTLLQKVTGLVIAAIITIINKGVFDSDKQIANYSAIINAFDLGAVVYVCYFSSWGRNHIIGVAGRSNKEIR